MYGGLQRSHKSDGSGRRNVRRAAVCWLKSMCRVAASEQCAHCFDAAHIQLLLQQVAVAATYHTAVQSKLLLSIRPCMVPASCGFRVSPVSSIMRRLPRSQADGQRVLVNQAQFVSVTVALINGLSSPEYVFYTYNLFSFLASPRVVGTRGLLREPNGEGTRGCGVRVAASGRPNITVCNHVPIALSAPQLLASILTAIPTDLSNWPSMAGEEAHRNWPTALLCIGALPPPSPPSFS